MMQSPAKLREYSTDLPTKYLTKCADTVVNTYTSKVLHRCANDCPGTQTRKLPGVADGQVSTVKMEGSGWSKPTAFMGQNLLRSYL